MPRIREQAIARRLISAAEQSSAANLAEYIFLPGFTTASSASDLAGRGVGLDVVQTEIRLLGGFIGVASTPNVETIFTVRLPVTVAMTRMLVVSAGGNLYALPSQMVRHVVLNQVHELRAAQAAGKISWREQDYRMSALPHALERGESGPVTTPAGIILVADGDNRMGLEVETVVGQFDLIIKNIGTRYARVSGVTGAAILPSGEVVLALNPFLARSQRAAAAEPEAVIGGERPRRRALVVDDSLTVRQITGRLLAKDGFEVSTARDGIEALEKVRDQLPSVVVLDIEMPRMDGFELMQSLRADPATRQVGIVVITSRSAQKHRSLAMESGADEFLGKPYSNEELLNKVHALEAMLAAREHHV